MTDPVAPRNTHDPASSDDPWDADAVAWLLTKTTDSDWTYVRLFEALRRQPWWLTNQPEAVKAASDLAALHGVRQIELSRGSRSIVRLLRTDPAAPDYPRDRHGFELELKGEVAVVLTWNPTIASDFDPSTTAQGIEQRGRFATNWSVSNRVNLPAETEFWFLRQGHGAKGIVGHGVTRSEPYTAEHYADSTRSMQYVDVDFDGLLDVDSPISLDALTTNAPGVQWRFIQGSGRDVDSESNLAIRTLWAARRQSDPRPELDADPGTYPEGALMRVSVNRYERNAEARRKCLEHHGYACQACGMSFEQVYGPIAKDYIHVHHTTPVSQMGSGYRVDPITDLVPLCANCHYVAHLQRPDPHSVDYVRTLLGR